MTPHIRKFVLTAHITFSVGWVGAVAAYLLLAITGLIARDVQTVRAVYISMDLIGWFVIVPLGLAALLTGLVESLSSPWGLFRYYWVALKFLLTSGATIILLLHMKAVSRMARFAAETTLSGSDFRALRIQLVTHAAGGLLVLLAITALSVYKPWGLTAYGLRRQRDRRRPADIPPYLNSNRGVKLGRKATSVPRWAYVAGIHAALLILLSVILHLSGGAGPWNH
jgi:hypothetical protein